MIRGHGPQRGGLPLALALLVGACQDAPSTEHRVVDLSSAPRIGEDGGGGAAEPGVPPLAGIEPEEAEAADGEAAAGAGEESGALELSGRGTLAAEAIEGVIAEERAGLEPCLARERKRDPAAAGSVVVRFAIARTGRVGSVRVLSSDFPGKAMARCLGKQIKRWRFPAPEGGAVTVTTPLRFAAP